MNMYEVCAKFGHVGRNYYIERIVAVKASTAKEAAAMVRQMPRVKHHHKDTIRYVNKINKEQYLNLLQKNNADPYMHCRNIQEQRMNCTLEVMRENKEDQRRRKDKIGKKHYHRKQELRNPRKYVLNYISYEEYVS